MNDVFKASKRSIRVIKLGGSLLETCDWGRRLSGWLATQSPAVNLVLVGGGPIVDAVRLMATMFRYDDQFLHWMCIDLMETSLQLVQPQLPDWPTLSTGLELQPDHLCRHSNALVSVRAFYDRQSEPSLEVPLPKNWQTTSDSLAALLACRCEAEELVLLKSCGPPEVKIGTQAQLSELAEQGVIDAAMPAIASRINCVRLVNLRIAG